MTRIPASRFCTALLALSALALMAPAAIAGDADFDEPDEHENGSPFFGEAKDVNGLKPIDGVRVRAEVKGGSFPIIVSTDGEGKFKFRGFGKDVAPDTVLIACSKDGYGLVDVTRRQLSRGAGAPVEVECLLEPKK